MKLGIQCLAQGPLKMCTRENLSVCFLQSSMLSFPVSYKSHTRGSHKEAECHSWESAKRSSSVSVRPLVAKRNGGLQLILSPAEPLSHQITLITH